MKRDEAGRIATRLFAYYPGVKNDTFVAYVAKIEQLTDPEAAARTVDLCVDAYKRLPSIAEFLETYRGQRSFAPQLPDPQWDSAIPAWEVAGYQELERQRAEIDAYAQSHREKAADPDDAEKAVAAQRRADKARHLIRSMVPRRIVGSDEPPLTQEWMPGEPEKLPNPVFASPPKPTED